MAQGARFVNDWGTVQIDQDYLNVSIVESGVAARGAWTAIVSRDLSPLVFYKIPPGANSLNNGVFSMVSLSGAPPKGRLGYTGYSGIVSDAPANLEYRIGNVGPANGGPLHGWGMKVWNAAGELSYNSLQPQMQIIASQTFNLDGVSSGTYGTITLPDSGQDYWIAFPQEYVQGGSWYDQGMQFFDCMGAGAYWQAPNALACAASVVLQYPLGWSVGVNHQDLYQPTLTYVVAKIV